MQNARLLFLYKSERLERCLKRDRNGFVIACVNLHSRAPHMTLGAGNADELLAVVIWRRPLWGRAGTPG